MEGISDSHVIAVRNSDLKLHFPNGRLKLDFPPCFSIMLPVKELSERVTLMSMLCPPKLYADLRQRLDPDRLLKWD